MVSRKTKNVLSKRKNLPQEVNIQPKKYKDRKRKSPTPDSNIDEKRPWEQRSVEEDQPHTNGSDWGSDEDDSLSESELKSLDECLSEIFKDSKFDNYVTSPPVSCPTNKEKDDLFIMRKEPIEFLKLPPLDDVFTAQDSASLNDTKNNTINYVEQKSSRNSPDMEIYDIYKQLTEETDTISGNVTCGNVHKENENEYNQFDNFRHFNYQTHIKTLNRKKSKSESETYFDICQANNGSLAPNGFFRPANMMGSLPDFSTINNLRTDLNTGFYTNFLLQNNTSLSQEITMDSMVVENILNF